MKQFKDLIGQKAEVAFEMGYRFRLHYIDAKTMEWTSLNKDTYGEVETETIYTHDIGDGLINVNWIEKTGVSVTHIIDLNKNTVFGYMSWDEDTAYGHRAVLTHSGTYTIL